MRVYISADIEGVTNVTDWTETERIGGTGYEWGLRADGLERYQLPV